eukprot:m.87624 g.87624  ORF g.87624 m.87624 type:complete len:580 (-) comp16412_c1_seq10:21-1760(-)
MPNKPGKTKCHEKHQLSYGFPGIVAPYAASFSSQEQIHHRNTEQLPQQDRSFRSLEDVGTENVPSKLIGDASCTSGIPRPQRNGEIFDVIPPATAHAFITPIFRPFCQPAYGIIASPTAFGHVHNRDCVQHAPVLPPSRPHSDSPPSMQRASRVNRTGTVTDISSAARRAHTTHEMDAAHAMHVSTVATPATAMIRSATSVTSAPSAMGRSPKRRRAATAVAGLGEFRMRGSGKSMVVRRPRHFPVVSVAGTDYKSPAWGNGSATGTLSSKRKAGKNVRVPPADLQNDIQTSACCSACLRFIMDRMIHYIITHPHPTSCRANKTFFEKYVETHCLEDRYKPEKRRPNKNQCFHCNENLITDPNGPPRTSKERFTLLWNHPGVQFAVTDKWYRKIQRCDIQVHDMTMFLISYKAFLTHEIIAECTAAIVNFTTVRDTLKAICHTMKRLQGTTAAHTYTENIRLTVASVMAVYKEQNTFDVLRIGRSVLNFWAWNGGIDPCDPLLKRASEIKRLQRGLYSVSPALSPEDRSKMLATARRKRAAMSDEELRLQMVLDFTEILDANKHAMARCTPHSNTVTDG